MHTYDKYYGSFEVTGNDLRVTDPCYELESTGGMTLINVKPGKWYTHAVIIDKQDSCGERVASLTVVHESYPDHYRPSIDVDCKPIIAVDSGQAGFFDINKYPKENGDIREKFYDENCRLTLSEEHGGIVFNSGVVTSSGYGDGCYRLYYDMDSDINSNGEIIAAEIVFIEDDEDDGYDDEDEDY